MAISTTFSAPFLRSPLTPDTNIIRPRISFRVKITDIEKQYELYSRECADRSYMIEEVDFTGYKPVAGIRFLRIIIEIASTKGFILFVLEISYAFQNTILPNPAERVYLSLQYL